MVKSVFQLIIILFEADQFISKCEKRGESKKAERKRERARERV
jgi:hypothetical protein